MKGFPIAERVPGLLQRVMRGRGSVLAVALAVMIGAAANGALAQQTRQPKIGFSNTQSAQLFQSPQEACTGPAQQYAADWVGVQTYMGTTNCGDYTVTVTGTAGTLPPFMASTGVCSMPVWAKRTISGPENNCAGAIPGTTDVVPPGTVANFLISSSFYCSTGWWMDSTTNLCTRVMAPAPPPATPKCGNPVFAGSGCKSEDVALGEVSSGVDLVTLTARYASTYPWGGGRLIGQPAWSLDPLDRRLEPAQGGAPLRLLEPGGGGTSFVAVAGGGYQSPSLQLKLEQIATGWRLWDYDRRFVETYNSSGTLASRRGFAGGGFDIAYATADGAIATSLTTTSGRIVGFAWGAQSLSSLTLPGGATIAFSYEDAPSAALPKLLKRITFADGKFREFHYASTKLGGVPIAGRSADSLVQRFPAVVGAPALAGPVSLRDAFVDRATDDLVSIVDERGVNFAQFEYDGNGIATSTQHAGGVQRFSFVHSSSNPNWVTSDVTGPVGGTTNFVFQPINGLLRLKEATTAPTAIGPGSAESLYYDSLGRLTSAVDSAAGSSRCWSYDSVTNRPAAIQEGPTWLSCANFSTTPIAAGVPARKTFSEWHPTWRLPIRQSTPRRRVTYSYNGDVDAGGAISCAPAAAQLAGLPMPLVCRVMEEATTDDTGSSGFAASVVGTPRVTRYTYNARGQVLSLDGPRTDVTDSTTYQYYESNGAAYAIGDLLSITSSGQTWTFGSYNARGQPLVVTDSNGLTITLAYHARGWPTSVAQASGSQTRTTLYAYNEAGLIQKVTQPDGGFINYLYDDAQRLTGMSDNLGNSITYTLDSAGNRIGESLRDPGNVLRRQVSRTFDAISRLQSVTGAPQ